MSNFKSEKYKCIDTSNEDGFFTEGKIYETYEFESDEEYGITLDGIVIRVDDGRLFHVSKETKESNFKLI